MIDLYYWPTPNGIKITIMLEELGLPYNVIPVNIGAGDQFKPKFLKLNPNHRMPVIVDHEGPGGKTMPLFESGAIMLYLAEKTGQLLPKDPVAKWKAVQWLMFQMGGIGPMLGQAHHFRQYAPEPVPYAVDRYTNEAKRLYGVLDKGLEDQDYLAGEYSIADIATWPWLRRPERQGIDRTEFRRLESWFQRIAARPAVKRGAAVMQEHQRKGSMTEAEREQLFGKTQYQRR